MKTVYEWFREYAQDVLADRDRRCKENVTAGIRAFLMEMDMLEESDPDGKVSRRELLRFKMMPTDTFAAFFEHYEERSRILQFRSDCALLAMNRLQNGVLLSKDAKILKLSSFFELTAELAKDSRYVSWISEVFALVQKDLAFAAGQSNGLSDDMAEWLGQKGWNEGEKDEQ